MNPEVMKNSWFIILCLIILTLGCFAISADYVMSDNITEIAEKWAQAVKNRDGKIQYNLLSSQCQAMIHDEYEALNWVTGTSSPWVKSYTVQVYDNSAEIIYEYESSVGFEGYYLQLLTFVKENGTLSINSFSEPKKI